MNLTTQAVRRRRVRVRVEGTVQGVGFRPYVYRLAQALGLGGFVLNDADGVLLEVEGGAEAVQEFLDRLGSGAPPLAVIERTLVSELELLGIPSFVISASSREKPAAAPITPDTATCEECLRELADPEDRRYRYPFINCTNCGPRFTIVRGIPYDRPFTTMAAFQMCATCQAEYEDPLDRRFHAQPNACPDCGPSLRVLDRTGAAVALAPGDDAVRHAARALLAGQIVGVKGIGGYHLACLAEDQVAVAALRSRKHREDKPFALMTRDLGAAAELVELDDAVAELLVSPARPIVLARRRDRAAVASAVAPGTPDLGVMLAYSPLHHLLLADVGAPLVMTSGNISDEPIAYRDTDALQRLSRVADLFMVHDRPIETRTDDSVVRVYDAAGSRRPLNMRRSRGYVPGALVLPGDGAPRPLLACGAELKNTFCVAKGRRAWVSHHIGDLENFETLRSFIEGIAHFERLFSLQPEFVAYDLHPAYLSTQYALERQGVQPIGIQHHHAHLAACLAEHGDPGPAIGAIYDGTGYGLDGSAWGGELLYGDLSQFRRVGSLRPVGLPGGAQAIRQPWRMACSWLVESAGGEPELPTALAGQVEARSWSAVARLARSGAHSPTTTSVGRLFDAVAALCGVRSVINYEGQAAIELEGRCDPSEKGSYPIELADDSGLLRLDPVPLIRAVVEDLRRGTSVGAVASRFHRAVANTTAAACAQAASDCATETVVLCGGVFANRRLLELTSAALATAGLRVLVPARLPIGDGGISYGQAAVAARRISG